MPLVFQVRVPGTCPGYVSPVRVPGEYDQDMERSDLELLRGLLLDTRVLTLALVEAGAPIAGVSPFLAASGLQSVYVHGSRLSRHMKALAPGVPFSAALHEPDHLGLDPLRLRRLLIEGEVAALDAGERDEIATRWVERFPSAMMTIGLGDFEFHRLDIRGGRMVAGFGSAFGIGPRVLAEAAGLEPPEPSRDN